MGLYLGSSKSKLYFDYTLSILELFSNTPILNGILLKSSDDYILTDINEVYLTAKEGE